VKTCKKCGESKGLDAFSGARSECKACVAKYDAKYYAENPEKERARKAKYYAENPEKERARKAKWRAENPEKERAIQAKYRAENLEKVRARDAKYYAKYRAENPEKVRARDAKYRAENVEKERANYAKYYASMTDGYVAAKLGFPVKKVPPQLIELKREHLRLVRLLKEKTK